MDASTSSNRETLSGNTSAQEQAEEPAASSKTCPECGRVFTKTAHLLRHRLVHDQQRPFSCDLCQKAFARPDALQRHVRTVHASCDVASESTGNGKRRRVENDGSSEGDVAAYAQAAESARQPEPVASSSSLDATGDSSSRPDPMGINDYSSLAALATGTSNSNFSAAPSVDLDANVGLGTFLPPMPFAFSTGATAPGFDEMIAGWLNHDGGLLATEHALTTAFGHQIAHVDQLASLPFGVIDHATMHSHPHPHLQPTFQSPRAASSSSARTQPSPRRPKRMAADTWESGMSNPHYDSAAPSRPESPQPREITSPEEVVAELNVNNEQPLAMPAPRVIPSMKFLEACLHLYFRDFHPVFPIIHKPTFERDRTPPLLLLSMCSIGCMFVGTQAARESGVWIYERLHHVIVITRDAKMATEESRITVMLSALLGQCFSFLHGQPKAMLTAESFHGSLCTKARRSGLAKQLKRNAVSGRQVESLEGAKLRKRWREWAGEETLRRLTMGLTIHAAESTIYSGLARLVPTPVSRADGVSDALFEAQSAEEWRRLLVTANGSDAGMGVSPLASMAPAELRTPHEAFLLTVLLAQTVVNIHKARELEMSPVEALSGPAFIDRLPPLPMFYDKMLMFAIHHNLHNVLGDTKEGQLPLTPEIRSLAALWNFTCLVRLTPMDLVAEVAGRGGNPDSESMAELQYWVTTPAARLAALHAGHLLYHAADLQDLGFLVPRAIFQATLLLLCYVSSAPSPTDVWRDAHPLDVMEASDWQYLSRLCESASMGVEHELFQAGLESSKSRAGRFVAYGELPIRVPGFFDGREKMLDLVSLRSRSNRLLRRCTPWGIGDTLSDILSMVCF